MNAQSARACGPHAERSTESSSGGSIGRNTSVGGGAAAASTAEAPLAPGVAALPFAAATALWQPAETHPSLYRGAPLNLKISNALEVKLREVLHEYRFRHCQRAEYSDHG
jgi:hypothetical protein